MPSVQSYTIKIQQFEGPFDLLLFFIERDEIDINDIPIAKITEDFLAYIKQLENLNIDVASEFILVAATLMRIKAKLLLPRKELDELGNEIDPREELARRLLEYKRYKEVLEELRGMEAERSMKHYRGNTSSELKKIAEKALIDVEMESLTMFKLFNSFQRLLAQFEERGSKTIHSIVRYNYTIDEQRAYIQSRISKAGEKVSFDTVFSTLENRIHAIVTFLSLLELLNMQRVRLTQGDGVNNFWLESVGTEEEE